jgi:hypothetical protein
VSSVIFAAAFVSVLVFSVVAAAIATPPLVAALLGALTVPEAGKWCSSLFTPYEDDLKRQREVIRAMQHGTRIQITELRNIEALANKLEIEIKSILHIADFALVHGEEEDAVKLAIDEMKKKLDVFMKTIQQLSEEADKCSRDIRCARTMVLGTMFGRENN